jgi:hypothetical protein
MDDAVRKLVVHPAPVLAKLPAAYREPETKRDVCALLLRFIAGVPMPVAKSIALWRWERGLALIPSKVLR